VDCEFPVVPLVAVVMAMVSLEAPFILSSSLFCLRNCKERKKKLGLILSAGLGVFYNYLFASLYSFFSNQLMNASTVSGLARQDALSPSSSSSGWGRQVFRVKPVEQQHVPSKQIQYQQPQHYQEDPRALPEQQQQQQQQQPVHHYVYPYVPSQLTPPHVSCVQQPVPMIMQPQAASSPVPQMMQYNYPQQIQPQQHASYSVPSPYVFMLPSSVNDSRDEKLPRHKRIHRRYRKREKRDEDDSDSTGSDYSSDDSDSDTLDDKEDGYDGNKYARYYPSKCKRRKKRKRSTMKKITERECVIPELVSFSERYAHDDDTMQQMDPRRQHPTPVHHPPDVPRSDSSVPVPPPPISKDQAGNDRGNCCHSYRYDSLWQVFLGILIFLCGYMFCFFTQARADMHKRTYLATDQGYRQGRLHRDSYSSSSPPPPFSSMPNLARHKQV
jgi:hypothetical protein